MTTGSVQLTTGEQRVIACYDELVATLRDEAEDLPPYVRRNAIKAAAALWQVANGAGVQPGHIYDIGV